MLTPSLIIAPTVSQWQASFTERLRFKIAGKSNIVGDDAWSQPRGGR